jgi:hypothetical protein
MIASRIAKLLLLGGLLLGLPMGMRAQQAAMPTLDQVLTGVHNNFLAYLSSVPNLFAEEHVVSSAHDGLMLNSGGTTDSIFRMRRGAIKDNMIELIESREAKGKHGGAAGSEQEVNGPSVAVGLFSYGAMDFSPDLKNCYDYRLESKPQQLRHTPVVVVDYVLREPLEANSHCPVTEPVSGRAFVNPATMQIVRVEQRRPQHEVYPRQIGVWSWSVDYGLADLDGRAFWLPETISAQSTSSTGRRMEWSFVATYRNYHLLTVHSTILPSHQ